MQLDSHNLGVLVLVTILAQATSLPSFSLTLHPDLLTPVSYSPCPGSADVSCVDGQTCCKLASSGFGCCPMEHAVCCSDGEHCCPGGTQCDLINLRCVRKHADGVTKFSSLTSINSTEPTQEVEESIQNDILDDYVVCPDSNFKCKIGHTCCKITGGWGCCPTENAVCCGDGKNCCPQGSTCDITTSTCIWPQVIRTLQTPMFKKEAAIRVTNDLEAQNNVVCSDSSLSCSEHHACCESPEGTTGCCPSTAICCDDGHSCCPVGSVCNTTATICDWPDEYYAEGYMSEALHILTNYNNFEIEVVVNQCPESGYQCSEKETCCNTDDNTYGCCPYKNGTCCSNGRHCCPEGSRCDLHEEVCVHENIFGQILFQSLTLNLRSHVVTNEIDTPEKLICPDKKFSCSEGQTCCQLVEGGYGCCPMTDAVCCPDKIHCCPKDTTCDLEKGSCVSSWTLPWLTNKRTMPELIKPQMKPRDQVYAGITVLPAGNSTRQECGVEQVSCEDDETCCMGGWTCCIITGKPTGCCNGEEADCCLDGLKCCPKPMKCTNDPASGKDCYFP